MSDTHKVTLLWMDGKSEIERNVKGDELVSRESMAL